MCKRTTPTPSIALAIVMFLVLFGAAYQQSHSLPATPSPTTPAPAPTPSLGSGTKPTTLVTAGLALPVTEDHDDIEFKTKGPTEVRMQQVVFTAGGNFGWHHHPGYALVAIQSGTVSLEDSNCNSVTYGPGLVTGSAFIMTGDAPMYTSSTTGATVYVTFVAPSAVFRIDDTPPPCASKVN